MNRFFLAMPVILFDYKALQNDFAHLSQGRWVPPQHLHLTLQFFGEKYEKTLLIQMLSDLNLQAEPSELIGLELFKHNTILYAKTKNPSVQVLHTQIQEAFSIQDEQKFIPHVTLMRIKKTPHPALLEKRVELYDERVIGTLQAKIQLIQSRLTPEGSKYTLLKEFN